MTGAIDLTHAVLLLGDAGEAEAIPVDADFWTNMDPRLSTGRMVSFVRSEANWPTWERHPEGDEVIHQLEGELLLIVEHPHGEERIALPRGMTAIVPRGLWHTADVIEAGFALYITPGANTAQRQRR